MSDALQLARIEISRFRRLSKPQVFEFAAGPGITILVGPNGSGKSTVLDAIEWTLTRNASRLPPLAASTSRAPSVYRTLGSDEDPDVALTFSDGSGAPHRLTSADGEEAVASLLRRGDPPWSDIKSVAAALRWTHFSSQRSTSRLGYEDGDAILKAFAAPAGLERLKGLDQRLWGRDTQAAVKDLEREVRVRERQHLAAMERLEQLSSPLLADGASGVGRRLAEVNAAVREIGVPLPGAGADIDSLESVLTAFRSNLEASLGDVRSLRASLRDLNPRVRRLAVEADEARQSLETAITVSDKRFEARDAAASERDARQADLDALVATRVRLSGALSLRAELLETSHARDSLRQRVGDVRLQHGTVSGRIGSLDELEKLTGRLRAGLALQEIDRQLAKLADLGDPEELRAAATRTVAELEARRDELTDRRVQSQAALSEETERLQSLAALAAAVAGHLHAEDTRCPVCAAVYGLGELIERAREAAVTPGPAAQQMTRAISETTHELGRVHGQLRIAVAKVEEARAVAAARVRHEADRVRQKELFGDGSRSVEALNGIESRILDLREELGAGDETETQLLRAELLEHHRRLAPMLIDLEGRLSDAENSLRDLGGKPRGDRSEADLRAELRTVEVEIDRLAVQLSAATTEYAFAFQLAEGAEHNLRRQREIQRIAAASLEEENKRVGQAADQLATILGSLAEDEFVKALQDRSVRLGLQLERLASIRDEVATAQLSPERDEELAMLRQTYLPAAKRVDPAELREAIGVELRRAQADISALDLLKERLSQRARVRRDIDKRLQGTALKPWNGLFRAVYASLAGSLGDTLEWTADRVDMRFSEIESHVRPSVAGEPIHGWLAGHYFSEGQLAALQISAMITASVLLPWSRWRALLLDDPLQHADVIKVGAFADLIRALCVDKGHQIIMTTHDRVQAEFVAAKFAAGKLDARIVTFERSSPGASGR